MILDKGKDGFFLEYFTAVWKSLGENEINQFASLENGEARVRFVAKHLAAGSAEFTLPVPVWSPDSKDLTAALKLKEEGNRAFQGKDYTLALRLYSQGMLLVPWSTEKQGSCEHLCVLLANRSAALYHLEMFSAALSDIEETLNLGEYPGHLRYKVLDRRARCLLASHQYLSARDALRATLAALDGARTLEGARRSKWQQDVQIMISMIEKGAQGRPLADAPQPSTSRHPSKLPPVSGNASSSHPAATSALHFEYGGPEQGRLARAARDVQAGETLVVEPPHVIALLAEHRGSHCWHCLSPLLHSPLPCPRCQEVAFCSATCQRAALGSKGSVRGHHTLECRFLPALWGAGASVTCLLALRGVSQTSLDKLKAIRGKLQHGPQQTYRGSSYLTFHALESHSARRSPSDLLHRSVMATFLLHGLVRGGFFGGEHSGDGGEKTGNLTDDEAYIGSLLLHNLQVCQFNAHEVSELRVTELTPLDTGYQPEEREVATSVFLGGAVYPTLALFNHSCSPGIVRYFLPGGVVVARAVRGVRAGEEVCENYGPLYTREPREVRRAKLQDQYWFMCHCQACEEDWPTFEGTPDLQQSSIRLKCGECGSALRVTAESPQIAVACSICGHKTSVLASLAALAGTEQKLQIAAGKVAGGEEADGLSCYLEVLNTLEKFLATPPVKDYILCQQAVRRCMMKLGNTAPQPKFSNVASQKR